MCVGMFERDRQRESQGVREKQRGESTCLKTLWVVLKMDEGEHGTRNTSSL